MTTRLTAACLLFWSLVMLRMTALAQSEFIYDGSDGVGLSGGYSFNENLHGPYAHAGFSTNGRFDLGMTIGYFTGDNISIKALGIGANLFVVKEDDDVPFSIALAGNAEVDVMSVETSWSKQQFDVQLAAFGVWGCKRITLSPTTFLLPSVGVMKVSSIDDEIEGYTVGTGALQIAFGGPGRPLWVIGVGVSRAEDLTTGSIGFGTILFRE